MKLNFKTICLLLSAVLTMAACVNDSNNNDSTSYNDMAITAFSLGTLNRYLHTTSSEGEDSIYKTTFSASSYMFHIDHINQKIYNTDSLPLGTDKAHVLCSATTRNNGVLAIKDMASDTIRTFSTTDSIDFTEPRDFVVLATDGSGSRTYTVSVNVHEQNGDEFNWTSMNSNTDIAALNGMRALCAGNKIVVMGNHNGNIAIYTTTDGSTWNTATPNVSIDADAWQSAVGRADSIFILSGNNVLRSADGSTWTEVGTDNTLKQLVAASHQELYALAQDGQLMISTNGGANWTAETLGDEEDGALLPQQDITYATTAMTQVGETDYVLLAGSRDATTYPQDEAAMVWRKIAAYDSNSETGKWVYLNVDDNNPYFLPRLANLTMLPYSDGVLAIGGNGIGNCTTKAFTQIYQSRDGGITWKKNARFVLPDNFESSTTSFAATADNKGHIWLFCGESGQVWRGHLNSVVWNYQ